MSIFKIIKDIAGLLVAHFFTRAILGIGLFLFILGGIIVYAIVYWLMGWLGFDASTTNIISVIALFFTSFLGVIFIALGIGLLLWARKNGQDLS